MMQLMHLTEQQFAALHRFFDQSDFSQHGAVITDLDGTAVHEYEGRTIIHQSVEMGLKKLHELGRPIIINTLRFPLSVIRTFGKEWHLITNSSIPVILLNGSQLGYITKTEGEFCFEQLASFPLATEEKEGVMNGVDRLVEGKLTDFLVFYYPEDWKEGEIIWTPVAEKIPYLQNKYKSASSVISTSAEELRQQLLSKSICMIFLLLEVPADKLMAYQHTHNSNFITHKNVDKLYGMKQMAALAGFELQHSIGAGDSSMDTFLDGVGLSVHVGNGRLPFKGLYDTLKLPGYVEYGDLLFQFASMQRTVTR